MPKYNLSKRSLKELSGVHQDLVAVVTRAMELTVQDFAVHDGIRTLDEQRRLLARGATRTLKSRHLDGYAVDLVPYINRRLRWEWEPIYDIAEAVRTGALELGVPIRWGGAWDVLLTATDDAPVDIVADYGRRRREAGKGAFLDGPHFELPKANYP